MVRGNQLILVKENAREIVGYVQMGQQCSGDWQPTSFCCRHVALWVGYHPKEQFKNKHGAKIHILQLYNNFLVLYSMFC